MDQRRATAFIFCTVTLDLLALGLMIPVLPHIVLGFMGGDTAGAAQVFGLFSTVWALMQFLFSPLLGVVSDRYGRRPVILISFASAWGSTTCSWRLRPRSRCYSSAGSSPASPRQPSAQVMPISPTSRR